MNTVYERMMKNEELFASVKEDPDRVEFLQADKFQIVVEHTASELFSKLLEVLESVEGGRDLLYWYDALSHFDIKKASVADHTDAQKAIGGFLKKYADKQNDGLS